MSTLTWIVTSFFAFLLATGGFIAVLERAVRRPINEAPLLINALVWGFMLVCIGLLWRYRRGVTRKYDEARRAEAAAAQAARAQKEQLRANSPWMRDPDDYTLPAFPANYARLPEDVQNEYLRKQSLRDEATKRVDRQLEEERVLHGTVLNAQQREVLIQRECRQLQALEDRTESVSREESRWRRQEQRQHQELVEAVENSTQFGRSRKFKQDHPFLSGLMGEEKVDKLTSQGWWKG